MSGSGKQITFKHSNKTSSKRDKSHPYSIDPDCLKRVKLHNKGCVGCFCNFKETVVRPVLPKIITDSKDFETISQCLYYGALDVIACKSKEEPVFEDKSSHKNEPVHSIVGNTCLDTSNYNFNEPLASTSFPQHYLNDFQTVYQQQGDSSSQQYSSTLNELLVHGQKHA